MSWRPLPEFPNYEIDKHGNVRNAKTKHRLSKRALRNSIVVTIKIERKSHNRSVQALMREIWPDVVYVPRINHSYLFERKESSE